MRSVPVVIGLVTVVAGVGCILVGWQMDDRPYLSSLLLELGATVFLVLPIVVIERLLERRVRQSEQTTRQRVREVAEDVTAVSDRLDEAQRNISDVQQLLSTRLQASADTDSQLLERAREDLSFRTVQAALNRAVQLGAISGFGLRVAVPGNYERLRFRHVTTEDAVPGGQDAEAIMISVEDAGGRDLAIRTLWQPDQTAVEAMATLAETWKRAGSYPGDAAINAERIFGWLIKSFGVAIRSRNRGGDAQLDPLIELLSSTWAMTDYGLEHLPDPYHIERTRLVSEGDVTNWRQHMREKGWIQAENEATHEAGEDDFWMVTEVARQFFGRNADQRRAAGSST